jgi:hypothetical protein
MAARLSRARLPLIGALTAVFLLTPAGPAHASAPPDPVTVEVLTVNGSGCPAGSATVTALPDNTGFRVTYGSFITQAGGSARPLDFRKNCQINLQVHIPPGFTFAISSAEYRGLANLQEGASGLQRTNYYFQASPDNNYVDHTFSGPLSKAWDTIDQAPELVYAPCGQFQNLNVNTELRVDKGTIHPDAVSSLSMRTTDGDIDTLLHFQWKEC